MAAADGTGRVSRAAPPCATGRPRELTDKLGEPIRVALEEGALRHSFGSDLWTLERVGLIVERQAGVCLSRASEWRLLTQQLGWSLQRPQRTGVYRTEAISDSGSSGSGGSDGQKPNDHGRVAQRARSRRYEARWRRGVRSSVSLPRAETCRSSVMVTSSANRPAGVSSMCASSVRIRAAAEGTSRL